MQFFKYHNITAQVIWSGADSSFRQPGFVCRKCMLINHIQVDQQSDSNFHKAENAVKCA